MRGVRDVWIADLTAMSLSNVQPMHAALAGAEVGEGMARDDARHDPGTLSASRLAMRLSRSTFSSAVNGLTFGGVML